MREAAMPFGEPAGFSGALLDCIATGIITIGPERQILAFNAAAERLTGLRANDVLHRTTAVLPPAVQTVIDETFATGTPVSRRKLLLGQTDGAEEVVQITTNVAQLQSGNILSVVAELQNLSDARQAADNLERLDRLANIGLLSAGVAHEIKNALVAVRTFVDLFAAQCEDADIAGIARKEIDRMDSVVRQILRGAAREEFKLVPLSVHALLNDVLNLLRPQTKAASVEVSVAFSAPADEIQGDERQLRHALLNLLINALEATDRGGELTVATAVIPVSKQPHLRVSISDKGCGIRPEDFPRLFNPFFTTKKEGTGIGLAIARRIIHEHQGAITVDSTVGHGTTFSVFLPLLEKS